MKRNFSRHAFTLIEMLIVIVIIGILAAALVPRLQSIQWRARDTKRKADALSISNALSIYKIDNSIYPNAWSLTWNNRVYSYQNPFNIAGLTGIMSSIPEDPINTSGSPLFTWGYSYMYGWLYKNSLTYTLFMRLENETDADRCWVKNYQYYVISYTATCTDVNCSGGTDCGKLYIKADLWP